MIFDYLSSEYGWTTEYILSRTIHEINWRMKKIYERVNINREFEMAIHGAKPESSTNAKAVEQKEQPEVKEAFKLMQLRKAQENGRKISNKN